MILPQLRWLSNPMAVINDLGVFVLEVISQVIELLCVRSGYILEQLRVDVLRNPIQCAERKIPRGSELIANKPRL
jgi:hypothetical protein